MTTATQSSVGHPRVVSRAEWLSARKELLAKEKALTQARDVLSAERRQLPWVKVEKSYLFEGPQGKQTLADLFGGRSQLIVYHFMFGPGWGEGCVGCSFHSDQIDGAIQHLQQHDVSYVTVSRALLSEILPFKKRMGWNFDWVSSNGSDFNYDFQVSFPKEEIAKGKVYYNFNMQEVPSEELSGTSVFYKEANGDIFHTYSTYARGGDIFLNAYNLLDMSPKGRNEGERGNLGHWVRHHDRYNAAGLVLPSGRYQAATKSETCCHEEKRA